MKFVDEATITVEAGKGGNGCLSFRREKYIPKGGPDGGDGGRGGHIMLRGNKQMWTLLHLKYSKHVIAEHGVPGSGQNKTGAQGRDIILEVPLGTVAKDAETGEEHFEITEDGETRILLEGGRGGLGNTHFKSSTRQTPRYAQPGEDGKEEWKILELKILADVGLVGFPNAGKSTLLSVMSAAKPKIADYAFTTLVPNLGIVSYRDHRSFVMADIPGIIEGAAEGKGLGSRFLRHIERNALLLFMVSAEAGNVNEEYRILLNEIEKHNPELMDKPRLLAITKSDVLDDELAALIEKELELDIPYIFISSVTGMGIQELKDLIWKEIESHCMA